MKKQWVLLLLVLAGTSAAAQTKSRVVEEIIARVNNEVITRSDLQRARTTLQDELRQECRACTPAQLQAAVSEKDKNLLRDLIDQSLLAQRGKDMGISVETDVIKRLDQIRQQNKIASMEDLEKKVSESGLSFEDFKGNIRNGLLTQEVIRREVGSKIILGREEVQKYYDAHTKEFERPEQVFLREIFVSTEGKREDEIPDLEKKAGELLARVNKGEDFTELAKRRSDGSTAANGGELGVFERGQLSKELEDVVFKMDKGQVTGVIRTKTGFLFLKVEQRYAAGIQPVEKVEGEIMNRLYFEKMDPALRKYLQNLRRDSYVVLKPGFVDTAGVSSSPIEEVAAVPDEGTSKKGKRRLLLLGRRKKSKG